jgi:phosphoribosylglycinamide formyltransferase-1
MSKLKIAVLISGRGSNLKALIEQCAEPDFPAEIALVITNKKDAGGLQYAEKAGIPYKFIDHKAFPNREAFDLAMHADLLTAGVHFVCLAGFMRILSKEFVDKWHDKMLNIHPSLLPLFPGLDTHKRAIESGLKYHGCTVHFVRSEVDSGPIIAQEIVEIADIDTEETLAKKVLDREHIAYKRSLKFIAHKTFMIKGNRVETWE